jgi:hypothetical protein
MLNKGNGNVRNNRNFGFMIWTWCIPAILYSVQLYV